MSDFRELLFCILLILLPLINILPGTKISNIDVDKFLKKVIASQQFDKIADKIAEKAAKKITHMKGFESNTVESNLSKVEPIYRVSEIEVKNNNRTIDIQPKEVDNTVESTTIKDTIIKYTISEISTGLNNNVMVPTDGLVLKFKHFTKLKDVNGTSSAQLQKDKPVNDDSFQEKEIQQKSDNIIKDNHSEGNDPKTASQSNEIREDILAAKNYNSAEYEVTSNESIINETTEKHIDDEDKTQTLAFKSRNAKAASHEATGDSGEQDSLNLDFEENYKAFIEYQKQQQEQQSPRGNPVAFQDSPSVEEVEPAVVNQSSFEENIPDTTVGTARNHRANAKHTDAFNDDELPTLVRKEGDKLFTYERSPDYNEYHDELSRKRSGNH